MRELPGLYWDETRRRYFSVASRPKFGATQASSSAQPLPTSRSFRQSPQSKREGFSVLKRISQAHSASQRDQERHFFAACQIASTSSDTSVHVPIVYSAPITSLKISDPVEKNVVDHMFIGDRQGWCYAGKSVDTIVAEVCLHSEISSIQQSADLTIYTSFGPDPRLLVRNPMTSATFVLRPSHLQDIRTSRLQRQSLTLGMRERALHLPDLERVSITQVLETGSDVFSLYCDGHDVWAGARDGTVRVFDLRSNQSQDALGSRFHNKHASVTHIQQVREHQLLIAAINGSLEIFDVRFSRGAAAEPLRTLAGHMNTYTHNLGIAVDETQDFLFAAGQDQRIRGWSLRTGETLQPPSTPDMHNPFSKTFAHPVYAMQVTSGNPVGTLWAASGLQLECFELGKHCAQLTT